MTFCLYNSLPYYEDELGEILSNSKNRKILPDGYSIPFSELTPITGLEKPYILKINKDGIILDQIESFLITENEASGNQYIDFVGIKDQKSTLDDIFVINIDNDFLQQHKVFVNDLTKFENLTLEAKILDEMVLYLKREFDPPDFVSKNEEVTDVKKEIISNYKLKLYQIGGLPSQKFFIASFEPIVEDYRFTHFSFLYLNQKVAKFGFHFKYISFNIDDQCYLGFTNCVTLDTGYVGKELYTIEGDQFEQVDADYSRAD